MNLKLIACKVLQREISLINTICKNFVDITFLRQGLHNEPEKLRKILQSEIDLIDNGRDSHSMTEKPFDAILLGYGICSNGALEIHSKKHTIVMPKAHDCITLLLGSKDTYKHYFEKFGGGIYWYSAGWLENAQMPSKERYERLYKEYCEKYGRDNADYLMETELSWMKEYSRLFYIRWDGLDFPDYVSHALGCAEYFNWDFDVLQGSPSLLSDLLNGNWDSDRFVVIPPNCKSIPSHDDDMITFAPADADV